ncbi:MAG: EAL domain-containing protein [Elsteraceae bacterium]
MGLWRSFATAARYEFQPIVNVHSGVCYGVEALLRGVEEAGFPNLAAMFERAEAEGAAADLESLLIAKAIDRFVSLAPPPTTHLFCNMSASGLRADGDLAGGLSALCAARGLAASLLCLEISETAAPLTRGILRRRALELRRAGLAVAIDDFGRGEAGLQLIYDAAPRFLKIDELFIRKLTSDPKSKGFVAGVIRLVHQIGVTVIAEGVETEAEFLACLEIGCDLAQGRFVQSPTLDPLKLNDRYGAIKATAERRRRRGGGEADTLASHLVDLPAVQFDADLVSAVELFRKNPDLDFLPVVNAALEPLGLIRERKLKSLLFTPYGWHLLRNARYRRRIGDLVEPCPVVDMHFPIEKLVASYATDAGEEGLIVIKDMRYAGFLSSRALLRVVAELELATARDQSPLTRLPGNNLIYGFVSRALGKSDEAFVLAYFDFDHFKPFNDKFGFRQGDRAILLFADLMRGHLPKDGCFIGHVGGDDFFAGFYDHAVDEAVALTRSLLTKFEEGVLSFYDAESRSKGYLESVDRDGAPRRFPLMTVSAVALKLLKGRPLSTADDVIASIAEAKKIAKHAPDHLAIVEGLSV